MKLEKDIERRAVTLAQRKGIFSVKLAKTSETGYPDRLYLLPGGRPLFVEYKRPGGVPTPKQKLIHERLRHLGYEVQIHYSVEETLQALEASPLST